MNREEERRKLVMRLREWLHKLLPDDSDKFDIEAETDSSLTFEENKEIIREKLQSLIKDLKSDAERVQAKEKEILNEKKREAEEEVNKWNEKIKYEEDQDIEQFYAPIYRAINKVCQGYSNLAFIKGRPGTGKSFSIRKQLKLNNADFVEVTGEVTEAYLYRLIYENNHKILWLKDVVKLLAALGSLNLLKSATETESARILTKSNYSKNQDDLPDRFVCKCKFIFDYNNLLAMGLRDDFEALISRGDFVEVPLGIDEIKQIMRSIAKTQEHKEITEFLIEHFNATGMFRLNLRTQWKAFNTFRYAKDNNLEWKKEVQSELQNTSRIRSLLVSLIGLKPVRRQELKKLLLRHELVHSMGTANRKINEWIFIDELYKVSPEDRNYYVCVEEINTKLDKNESWKK